MASTSEELANQAVQLKQVASFFKLKKEQGAFSSHFAQQTAAASTLEAKHQQQKPVQETQGILIDMEDEKNKEDFKQY